MLKISDCSPQLHALMVGAIAFRWQDLQHCPSLTHALFPSHWGKHRNLQLFSHSGIKNKTNFLIVMFFLTVAVSTHIREIRVSVNNLKKKKSQSKSHQEIVCLWISVEYKWFIFFWTKKLISVCIHTVFLLLSYVFINWIRCSVQWNLYS